MTAAMAIGPLGSVALAEVVALPELRAEAGRR
jgi:hypothetical protein